VSYYSDLEPHWNERPYFAKVEQQRGRTGLHIDTGSRSGSGLARRPDQVALLPGPCIRPHKASCVTGCSLISIASCCREWEETKCWAAYPRRCRNSLTCLPERGSPAFRRKLLAWALQQRRPWIHVLWDVLREFLPRIIVSPARAPAPRGMAPVRLCTAEPHRFPGPDEGSVVWAASQFSGKSERPSMHCAGHLACTCLVLDPCYEKRYPVSRSNTPWSSCMRFTRATSPTRPAPVA